MNVGPPTLCSSSRTKVKGGALFVAPKPESPPGSVAERCQQPAGNSGLTTDIETPQFTTLLRILAGRREGVHRRNHLGECSSTWCGIQLGEGEGVHRRTILVGRSHVYHPEPCFCRSVSNTNASAAGARRQDAEDPAGLGRSVSHLAEPTNWLPSAASSC
jgi:hypothetical protein